MKWIDANERKPKADEWVLAINVCMRDGYPEPYIAYVDEKGFWFSKDTGEPLYNVSEWCNIEIDYNA